MEPETAAPRFQLYYWPISFRGCFVSYLFAYKAVPLTVISDYEQISALQDLPPLEQAIPFFGPPVLHDRKTGRSLSQMPAIVLYVAGELDLVPDDPYAVALRLKVLMDCNDLLMEICRYNGSIMWDRVEWVLFRSERLPRWMQVFEASLTRGTIGTDPVTFVDIGVFALFGTMIRCLPELEPDLIKQAPGIHALCQRIGAKPSLAAYVEEETRAYGDTYCGGQIEASIRAMLLADANE